MVGAFGPDCVNAAVKILLKHLVIQKEQGTEGLVLRGSGDLFCDGEVAEEGFDFGNAHALR